MSSDSDSEDIRVTFYGPRPDEVEIPAITGDDDFKKSMSQDKHWKPLFVAADKKLKDIVEGCMTADKVEPIEIVPNIAEQKIVDDFLSLINPHRNHVYTKLKKLPDSGVVNPAIQLLFHWHDFMLHITQPIESELFTELVELLKSIAVAAKSGNIVSAEGFSTFFHQYITTTNQSILPTCQTSPLEYFKTIVLEVSRVVHTPCYYDTASRLENHILAHEKFLAEQFNSWFSDQLVSQIAEFKLCKHCHCASASWAHVWNIVISLKKTDGSTRPLGRGKTAHTPNTLSSLIEKQYQNDLRNKSDDLCSKCTFDVAAKVNYHHFALLPTILLVDLERKINDDKVDIETNIKLLNLDGASNNYNLHACVVRTENDYSVIVFDKEKIVQLADDSIIELSPEIASKCINAQAELLFFVSE